MALTNLPYDDEVIAEAVAGRRPRRVQSVTVDFASDDVGEDEVATVTVTSSWTLSAAEALRVLRAATPGP